jgi:CheY-like chemotaxis protein
MPERDGYEVAAFVKNAPHLAHIPVLLLTGAFEPIDEQRAGAVGCDGVLAKPFEPHMVITRVKELLAGGSAGVVVREPKGTGPSPREAVAHAVEDAAPATTDERGDAAAPPAPMSAGSDAAPEAELSDASFRISRRTPIAVPGFGAPAPPVEKHAALDEYFDRLDAAFANLQQPPPAAEPPSAEPAPPAPSAGSGEEIPSPDAVPAQAPSAPAAATPSPTPRAPGIAQAFSALFAAERGEAVPDVPVLLGPAALPQASMDDLVERVTRQVLERLSDRVVRDTVTDIVSRVSERLVRDEIERVKATLK